MAKTELILLGWRQKLDTLTSSPSLVINGAPVNQVSTSKFLIFIDENFTWSNHIDKFAKKITSSIVAVKWVRRFVPFSTLLCIYNVLIIVVSSGGNCSIKLSESKSSKIVQPGHWPTQALILMLLFLLSLTYLLTGATTTPSL